MAPRTVAVSLMAVFVFKLTCALFLAHLMDESLSPGRLGAFLARESGDTFSYIEPVKNTLSEGTYYWFNGERRVYAGRLPHYGLLYGALISLLGDRFGADALALLQVVADALAVLASAILAARLTGSRAAAIAAVMIGTASLHATPYTIRIVPESLSISTIALLLLALERARGDNTARAVVTVGLLAAILVSLKPFMLPFVAGLFPFLLQQRRTLWTTEPAGSLLRASLLFFCPFLVLLGPWVARNAWQLGRFVPLQENVTAGYPFDDAWLAYRRYLGAWGETAVWWDKRSAGCYFDPHPGFECEFVLPPEALTLSGGRDAVESARRLLAASRKDSGVVPSATAAFDRLRGTYRRERPVEFWVGAPLRLTRAMLIHSGSYLIPASSGEGNSSLVRLLKRSQSALYYFIVSCGLAGSVVLARRFRGAWPLAAVPFYLIVLFAWILRIVEFRYFDLAWPTLVVGSSCLASEGMTTVFRLVRGAGMSRKSRLTDAEAPAPGDQDDKAKCSGPDGPD